VQPDSANIAHPLQLFPLLHDAPPGWMAALRHDARGCCSCRPAGARLFDEQTQCNAFPLVLDGAIRVSKFSAQEREILLYRVGPGESCVLTSGCLLGRMPYAATAIAETAVTLIALPRPLFDRLLAQHDPFRRYVFELFSARLAEPMLLIEEVASGDSISVLLRCCWRGDPQCTPSIRPSPTSWAACCEMVSRLLGHFADQQ